MVVLQIETVSRDGYGNRLCPAAAVFTVGLLVHRFPKEIASELKNNDDMEPCHDCLIEDNESLHNGGDETPTTLRSTSEIVRSRGKGLTINGGYQESHGQGELSGEHHSRASCHRKNCKRKSSKSYNKSADKWMESSYAVHQNLNWVRWRQSSIVGVNL
ncbi:hypothetical protein B0O80DRAFT_501947 [Mortierella sp. GBAus27b]|nr:hypothetical protein B0O80DRAFT_501947 [Mortierella sp. GBAus27b]